MKKARKEEKEGKKFKRRKCQACSSGQSLEPDGGGERGAPVERSCCVELGARKTCSVTI